MATRIRITRVTDGEEIARQMLPAMESLGQAIGTRMQRLVPKRTFALHDTIDSKAEQRGAKVVTTVGFGGGDVDYGMHVERGTSRMAAQPFARPALLQSRAADLSFGGSITRAGVRTISTRRSRLRGRSTS